MKKETNQNAAAEQPAAPTSTAATTTPESAEVAEARKAAERRKRADALEEVTKIIGIDVKNSCDQVASFCIVDNPEHVRKAYDLLLERLGRAHAILKEQIENLPTLTIQ
jgi:hypothetical protein